MTLLRLTFVIIISFTVCYVANVRADVPGAWMDTSYDPKVFPGTYTINQDNYQNVLTEKTRIFADMQCAHGVYGWTGTNVLFQNECWYDAQFGKISTAGYVVSLGEQQAAPFTDQNSEYFPTKNKDVFVQTPLNADDGLRGLRFWAVEDMDFSEVRPDGPEGPLYYQLPENSSHIVRNSDGSIYTFDNNLLYSNITYSEDGNWMAIRYDEGYIDLFNLQDFSWQRIQTFYAGYATLAISNSGRYVAVAAFGEQPFVMDTNSCSAVGATFADATTCASRFLGLHLENTQDGDSRSVLPTFYDEDTLELYGRSASGDYQEFIVHAPGSSKGSNYFAMGDSFISGEGIGSYMEGTNQLFGNRCHTSLSSYPYLLKQQLNLESIYSVACSGAKTSDIDKEAQHVIADPGLLPGTRRQIGFVRDYHLATGDSVDAVFVSIGGNDIGFGSKILRCRLSDECFMYYEDRIEIIDEINRTFPRLVEVYDKIRREVRPGTKIYVTGYPYIFSSNQACFLFNSDFNRAEVQFSEQLIDYLNHAIHLAAQKAGVQYIDISRAFVGHRLCESFRQGAVNGMRLGWNYAESYHPNAYGHEKLAKSVKEGSWEFTKEILRPNRDIVLPVQFDDLIMLDKRTRSGRTIYKLYYSNDLSLETRVLKSQKVQTIIDGVRYNLVPGSEYSLWQHSDPTLLGTYAADENGDVHLEYTILPDTEVGYHELHLKGKNADGKDIDIYQSIYVDNLVGSVTTVPTVSPNAQRQNQNIDTEDITFDVTSSDVPRPSRVDSIPFLDDVKDEGGGEKQSMVPAAAVIIAIVIVIASIIIRVIDKKRRHAANLTK